MALVCCGHSYAILPLFFFLTSIRDSNSPKQLSYIFFNINAGLATRQIFSARSQLGTSIVPYPVGFLGLTWSTFVAMFIVFVLMLIEWYFQLWTLKGDEITLYSKPKYCSWNLMHPVCRPEQIHEIQIRDKE